MALSNSEPTPACQQSPGRPRVLIVRAGAIGDTLMATPLVRAVRRAFPACHLVFLCSATALDVLRFNPYIDQVIPVARRHVPAWLSPEKRRIHRTLRALDLDWALVLESHPSLIDLARQGGALLLHHILRRHGRSHDHVGQQFHGERQVLVEHADVVRGVFLRRERVELAADRVNFFGDVLRAPRGRTFEEHVFDEMRDTAFRVAFMPRAAREPHADGD